ncbi:MAG: Lrp/AsnC family transcriptional regulator [Gammaproteobacteria bacterium]|nr:Lrp/AsnC family transcriptional regulator [Gammaproteobacteria bacterium]
MKQLALDAIDIKILAAVQKHGQLSKTKLAEVVNLSPTPCWARLHKLKTAGYIRGYHADIALDMLADVTQVVVTVSLRNHSKADFQRFEQFVAQQDPIIDCVTTGGGMDYVMRVCCRNLGEFQMLMDEMSASELAVERYITYIVTRQVKSIQPNLKQLLPSRSLLP